MGRIMRIREVTKTIGLGRATLYKMLEAGEFPRPIKLGARSIGFKSEEVQDWIDSRERA